MQRSDTLTDICYTYFYNFWFILVSCENLSYGCHRLYPPFRITWYHGQVLVWFVLYFLCGVICIIVLIGLSMIVLVPWSAMTDIDRLSKQKPVSFVLMSYIVTLRLWLLFSCYVITYGLSPCHTTLKIFFYIQIDKKNYW